MSCVMVIFVKSSLIPYNINLIFIMNTKETFVIQGLAGEKKLKGTVKINGAKNAALKAMAAAVLFDGPVRLKNVPHNDDVETLATILRKLGAKVEWQDHELIIDATPVSSTDIDPELAQKMRASVVLTGPLLGRFGSASFCTPGGCVLGTRPIDLFINGYTKMGATAEFIENLCNIRSISKLKGTEIFFNIQAVGPTETLMMAAVLAEGTTVLKNCAMEPEIVNVAEWLNVGGANITGAGSSTITIEGTGGKLLSHTAEYTTIPDRIEAGSYLLLGALCAEELTLTDCRPDHMEAVVALLRTSGVPIQTSADSITIRGNSKPNSSFSAFNVRTHEYPGYPTDIQAQIVTYLTQVTGEGIIFETIFEARFKYVEDLSKLGAHITVMNPREILVKGPSDFSALPDSEELQAHDIRAGFAVVMAALVGKGAFIVNNVHLIDRGYEKLEERLQALGADIQRKR
jgi:UDP-N-acetylglucosamine 1-carboxyvinyltransferase